MQTEIMSSSPLLDPNGNLTQAGWARQPLWDCNLEKARFYAFRPLQFLRVKRWDYYGITTRNFFLSITLAHLGYAGTVFLYTLDFATGELIEETLLVPLGRGIRLARNSDQGDCSFHNGQVGIDFTLEEGARRVQIDWPAYNHGQGLTAAVALRCPPAHESMTIVTPIGKRRFYYNRKLNCLPAEGWVRRGETRVELCPERDLGNLDWGRGVWEYKSFWVWASASAYLPDGRTLGLNLGYGFGDTNAATEHAFVLNGRVHKLGEVAFTYDPSDFMSPWSIKAADGRLDLRFVPFKERVARSDVAVIHSEVHQMFGDYSGTVRTDEGEEILLDGVIGWAEEHHAQW